jgi:hypothetical protein
VESYSRAARFPAERGDAARALPASQRRRKRRFTRRQAVDPLFHQVLDPLGNVAGDTLLALVPVATLLFLLAVVRMSAWRAVIIGSAVTIVLGIVAWQAPAGATFASYGLGAATGFWSIDWIVFWGVIIYNTLVVTGAFEDFKRWLIAQATADIRVQTLLMAWAFGALMEGLVGFGYPWAVVAPILIALGVADLAAIRVAAIANNAPVSFGALGAPIIGLAAVTGLPLLDLSASIGKIVAILALGPPWVLIYLVSGRRGSSARTCRTSSARWCASAPCSSCSASGGRGRSSASGGASSPRRRSAPTSGRPSCRPAFPTPPAPPRPPGPRGSAAGAWPAR